MPSPVVIQYREKRKECNSDLLIMRVGEFYELFDGDAAVAAAILGITLSQRKFLGTGKREAPVDMLGFPSKELLRYATMLLDAGLNLVLCNWEPKKKQA